MELLFKSCPCNSFEDLKAIDSFWCCPILKSAISLSAYNKTCWLTISALLNSTCAWQCKMIDTSLYISLGAGWGICTETRKLVGCTRWWVSFTCRCLKWWEKEWPMVACSFLLLPCTACCFFFVIFFYTVSTFTDLPMILFPRWGCGWTTYFLYGGKF